MKKLLVALLGKPKLEAAISVTVAELKKVIKWAIDNDQPTEVVNKLKKIQKAKERPALGKDTPKGTDNIIRRYPKAWNPEQIRRLTDDLRTAVERAKEWQSSKELIGKPNLEAGIKAAKQKAKSNKPYRDHLGRPVATKAEMYKFDEPSNLPHLSITSLINKAPVDITKMKSVDEYVKNILNFADDQHKKAGEELIPIVVRDLSRWAKKDWKKHTKNIDPNKPKKPTMQKGGSYKGKKHNYSAGGKVNELKNFKKRKV